MIYEKHGAAARISLNRPQVLNAYNIQMRDDLSQALAAVADDPEGAPAHKIFVQAGSIGSVIPDLDDLAGRIARFAVADFDDRASALPTPPNAPRREGLADLRARVQALEDALRKQGALQPASP